MNDLGGTVAGTGGSRAVADAVVEEIKAAGGEAVANYDSVATEEGGKRVIQTALDAFGTVDILINNAGNVRDKSFAKMDLGDFRSLIDVHLMGAVYCTHAAWPIMREKGFGRIVMTTLIRRPVRQSRPYQLWDGENGPDRAHELPQGRGPTL